MFDPQYDKYCREQEKIKRDPNEPKQESQIIKLLKEEQQKKQADDELKLLLEREKETLNKMADG